MLIMHEVLGHRVDFAKKECPLTGPCASLPHTHTQRDSCNFCGGGGYFHKIHHFSLINFMFKMLQIPGKLVDMLLLIVTRSSNDVRCLTSTVYGNALSVREDLRPLADIHFLPVWDSCEANSPPPQFLPK